jgi:hypothetical protein
MPRPNQITFSWLEPEDPSGAAVTEGDLTPHAPDPDPYRCERVGEPASNPRPAQATRVSPGTAELPADTELWRIQHAAQFLKMSVGWVYKRVERGELPCVRVNGWALRFVPADLRRWASLQGRRR